MNILVILIPVSLILGSVGLVAFLWSLRADQYEDMDGAAWRILIDDDAVPQDDDKRAD
jgi:cbb3-type cytochrome oxidase maturation protein